MIIVEYFSWKWPTLFYSWTSWGFCLFIPPTCQGPSGYHPHPPAYQWLPSPTCHYFWSCSEYVLSLSTRSLMITEQYWSQYCLLRHAFHNWPSCRFLTINHYSLSLTAQPVSHWPFLLEGIPSIAPPFGCRDAMRDCIKRLAEVNVNSIHFPVHIHRACHSIIEGSQVHRHDFPSFNLAVCS